MRHSMQALLRPPLKLMPVGCSGSIWKGSRMEVSVGE
jgi:hypothetical protein